MWLWLLLTSDISVFASSQRFLHSVNNFPRAACWVDSYQFRLFFFFVAGLNFQIASSRQRIDGTGGHSFLRMYYYGFCSTTLPHTTFGLKHLLYDAVMTLDSAGFKRCSKNGFRLQKLSSLTWPHSPFHMISLVRRWDFTKSFSVCTRLYAPLGKSMILKIPVTNNLPSLSALGLRFSGISPDHKDRVGLAGLLLCTASSFPRTIIGFFLQILSWLAGSLSFFTVAFLSRGAMKGVVFV